MTDFGFFNICANSEDIVYWEKRGELERGDHLIVPNKRKDLHPYQIIKDQDPGSPKVRDPDPQ